MPAYMPKTTRPAPPPGKRKPRVDHEFNEQAALFSWARCPAVVRKYPALRLLSCSLNGVKLSKAQAGKAKAAGMLKGEHDVRLPVARGGYAGLSIEMKAGRNKPTPEQLEYGDLIADEGWLVCYCWSWTDASNEIMAYLQAGRTLLASSGSISTPIG